MSDISFEFDVLMMGERCEASEAFAKANADWKCKRWDNGGFLAEPPALPDDGLGVASFVARYVDAYTTQLSALRLLVRTRPFALPFTSIHPRSRL